VDAGVRLILIVHQNKGYEEIRRSMTARGIAPTGVDVMAPDYLAVAQACGWQARGPASLDCLADELEQAAVADVPTLVLLQDQLFGEPSP